MADSIKCPNCSANLRFEPSNQKLVCDYCGGSFSPSELEKIAGDIIDDKKDSASDTVEVVEDTKVQEHLEAIEDIDQAPVENIEFTCNSCGGKILADLNTSATFCPFCGSPAIVKKSITGEFKPDYIIPFKITREQAENTFIGWAKGGRYTPFNFVSQENIAKITGLYVPFWLYDFTTDFDLEGTAEKNYSLGDYSYHEVYQISRKGHYEWKKIPFDGETRIEDKLMEAIEPYKYGDLKDFDYKYLQGFFADRYDQSPEDLKVRVDKRFNKYMNDVRNSLFKGYSSHKIKRDDTKIHKPEAKYALLPIWFLSYKYLGKYYYFAINGQTGEVAGTLPVSRVKRLMLFSGILAISAVIVRLIVGYYLGGYVG
ncbi:MAG: hypothetical protein J5786_07480 [Clostridiales bacterium]|nr:hypothetical protein [Clostridiales bacterium]